MINKIKELALLVDSWLENEVANFNLENSLQEASSYSLLSAAKRIRPILSLLTAEMLQLEKEQLKSFCLALELIHTASLIHDDLPALDNDDYRRGQLSCHKKFSEATAIITGDFLIAKAFDLLTSDSKIDFMAQSAWVKLVSQATVSLCDGQMMDLNFKSYANQKDQLENLDLQKTAALITASVLGPLYLLEENSQEKFYQSLKQYGQNLGLLFQVTDDLIDGVQDKDKEGPNYMSFFKQNEVEALADQLLLACENSLKVFESRGEQLKELAKLIRYRKS